MNRFVITIATVVLFASLAGAQEVKHAPTIDQCRADYNVWNGELGQTNPYDHLSFDELSERWKEMTKCALVDEEMKVFYQVLGWDYSMTQVARLTGFIEKHKLSLQFENEDKAGKR